MAKRPKRITYHPACKLFPKLGQEELHELAEDIKVNGLQHDIVLYEGKVLDGRNRLAACKIAKVKPKFTNWKGIGSPLEWVISENLMRRHLTPSQRAVVALDMLPMLEKEAKERQRKSNSFRLGQDCPNRNGNGKGKATEVAGQIAGSSARYVARVKAIKKDSPALVERIRSGELTVPEAERRLRQQQVLTKTRNKRRKRRKVLAALPDRVLHGDCFDLIPTLDDGSVNLVVTSPPYANQRKGHYKSVPEKDYPDWTVQWMELLWDKLTDDGSVLIVIRPHLRKGSISDYVLRTRLALREDGWTECEELIWLKPDAPPLGSTKRPRRSWEKILWFSKSGNPYCNPKACGKESDRIGFLTSFRFAVNGKSPISTGQSCDVRNGISRCSDVFVAGVSRDDIDHPAVFPVSLAEQLVLTFSRKGDFVLDCFCGSGSTLVAAKPLGRDYLGFEKMKRYVKVARERLAGE